jgi:hypothetical protein
VKNVALITGASGGLGAEFARIHASGGGDLVLVARSGEKLRQLKYDLESAHSVNVLVITEDLSAKGSAQTIYEATESEGIVIDVLINNAGFGGHGCFVDRELMKEEAMMQLNIATLTSLTHLYLKVMVGRGKGKILNVASTAAFLPGPLQAVYYATKAYVLSFSQAIAEELRGSGVSVTALCPGPIKTSFAAAGGLDGVKAFENAASPESVAQCGYSAMRRGKLVVINDWKLSLILNWIVPFLPRKTVLSISRKSMEKSK